MSYLSRFTCWVWQVVQMHIHCNYLHRMTALYAIQVLTESLDVDMLGKVMLPREQIRVCMVWKVGHARSRRRHSLWLWCGTVSKTVLDASDRPMGFGAFMNVFISSTENFSLRVCLWAVWANGGHVAIDTLEGYRGDSRRGLCYLRTRRFVFARLKHDCVERIFCRRSRSDSNAPPCDTVVRDPTGDDIIKRWKIIVLYIHFLELSFFYGVVILHSSASMMYLVMLYADWLWSLFFFLFRRRFSRLCFAWRRTPCPTSGSTCLGRYNGWRRVYRFVNFPNMLCVPE